MKTVFKNNNGLLIMENMESYLRQKMPDCCLYSDDGYKFMIHKVNISTFTSYQEIIDLLLFYTFYTRNVFKGFTYVLLGFYYTYWLIFFLIESIISAGLYQ